MAKNKLSDLRNHLFETLERLNDEEKPLDVERARTISQVACKIIEAAKVELKYLDLCGAEASEFFDTPKKPEPVPLPLPRANQRVLPS